VNETWWLADGVREWLQPQAPFDVAAWMTLAGEGSLLSSDRQSAAVRVDGDSTLLVKWRRPRRGRRLRTWRRASRERKEAAAALFAKELGIATPQPLAVGERRHGGVLQGAVLIRPFEPGRRDGREVAKEDPSVIDTIAKALRTWHDMGFRHGDCYPKNVLVDVGGANPVPIGFPYAHFELADEVIDQARAKDLAQFAAGCKELALDPFAFLVAYGLPARAQAEPIYKQIMRRKAQRIATRPQREPDGPPAPVPLEVASRASDVGIRALSELL